MVCPESRMGSPAELAPNERESVTPGRKPSMAALTPSSSLKSAPSLARAVVPARAGDSSATSATEATR